MNGLIKLLSLFCIWAPLSIAAAEKPNIVFVMIDDLGAEQIGCYGSETYKTPHIDKLATKGMLFNNAFAQPMCQISRATLMSGQYGFRNGFPKNNDRPLSSKDGWGNGLPSVANLLQDAGYTTAMSGKWHLAHFDRHPDHLTDQGFEYQNAWAHVIGGKRTRRYWETTYYREKELVTDAPGIFGPDEFCRYVTDFMEEHHDEDQPFFAYYPMVLVHFPFPQTPDNIDDPQPGWTPEDNLRIAEQKKWSAQNYTAMVEYTDKLIGQVASKIDALGIAENTLLIVTGDNGSYYKTKTQYKGQLIKGGKGSVTDSGGRVPFIAYWKGKIEPGSVNEKLIDFTDVLPTLVELGGGELPADHILDGMSVLGQLLGQKNAPSRDWVFMGNSPKAMIRADRFSLDAADQLYDLRENRYQPEPVPKSEFTKVQKSYHKMLSEAMESLDHPFTAGLKPGGEKKVRKKRQN